jgi:hypothetical protein
MWAGIHGVATLHLANKLVSGRSADATLDAMTEALVRAHLPLEASATSATNATNATNAPKHATKRGRTESAATATKQRRTERAASAPSTKTRARTKASTKRSTKGKRR